MKLELKVFDEQIPLLSGLKREDLKQTVTQDALEEQWMGNIGDIISYVVI
jgi:hypothetical protein